MNEWIDQIINSGTTVWAIIPAAFLLGLVGTFTSCCNYAIIGSVAGYSAGYATDTSRKKLFLFTVSFFFGSVLSLTIFGAIMGYAGSALAGVIGSYWKLVAAILLIIFGLLSFGLIPIKLPPIKFNTKKAGIWPGFVLGLITGGISMSCSACCNPVLPLVLGASFVKASALWGILILFFFSLGYSLPLAIAIAGIQAGTGSISNRIKNAGKIIIYAAGAIMVITGFYLIFTY